MTSDLEEKLTPICISGAMNVKMVKLNSLRKTHRMWLRAPFTQPTAITLRQIDERLIRAIKKNFHIYSIMQADSITRTTATT